MIDWNKNIQNQIKYHQRFNHTAKFWILTPLLISFGFKLLWGWRSLIQLHCGVYSDKLLHGTVWSDIVLHCTMWRDILQHCTVYSNIMLHCVVCSDILLHRAVFSNVLLHCAMWSFLQRVRLPQLPAILVQCDQGAEKCSTVQCREVQCSAEKCSVVQWSTVQCSAEKFSVELCITVQCIAAMCSEMQWSILKCSVVQWSTGISITHCGDGSGGRLPNLAIQHCIALYCMVLYRAGMCCTVM